MAKIGHLPTDFQLRSHELIEAGRYLFEQGWVPAASGNFSARLADGSIVITAPGRRKGRLHAGDFIVVDSNGYPQWTTLTPSAETPLHLMLYRRYPEVNAVLHTHSLSATLLSRNIGTTLRLEGYEMLKAFAGITTHKTAIIIPNIANDLDIARLGTEVENYLDTQGAIYGYLISGHGLYTWGHTVEDALRHVEAFEFLFQCELHGYKG